MNRKSLVKSEERDSVSGEKGSVVPEEDGFWSLGEGFGLKRGWYDC